MPKTYRILGINTDFNSFDDKVFIQDDIRTNRLFLDYDTILIDTTDLLSTYIEDRTSSTYNEKVLFSKNQSCSILEDFDRANDQIMECLRNGKNVFVVLGKNDRSYMYTGGTKRYGRRDAQDLNTISESNPFAFLPLTLEPTFVDGEKYSVVCQAPYSLFFEKVKEMLCYAGYFYAPKSALLTASNGKAISAVFEVEKGKIIILPDYYAESYYEDEEEGRRHAKQYIDALIELNNALETTKEKYVLPQWADDFLILNEAAEGEALQRIKDEIKDAETRLKKQEEILALVQRKKRLFTATGNVLENAVQEILQELGFVLCKAEKGRSDIIASYNGLDVVAEIKGVTKSAAEKHAAQLEKWSTLFVEKNERVPKALLIVNGYCEMPLDNRTEEVFPDQMLEYCVARKHALITTTQLLCLYIEINTNPVCAEERINELLSCVGRYQRYQNYKDYITIKSEEP